MTIPNPTPYRLKLAEVPQFLTSTRAILGKTPGFYIHLEEAARQEGCALRMNKNPRTYGESVNPYVLCFASEEDMVMFKIKWS